MKTILLWDPRFPDRRPTRLSVHDDVASAAVRAGVAAAADPADAGALAAGPPVSNAEPISVVLQHGSLNRLATVTLPKAVVAVGAALGVIATKDGASVTPTPTPTPVTVVSAANRLGIAQGNNASPGVAAVGTGNSLVTFRKWYKSNKALTELAPELWNGWVSTSAAAQELANDNDLPIRQSIIYGIPQAQKWTFDLSASTLVQCTYASAFSGDAEHIWKLDGTNPSASELQAAKNAGNLTLTDSNRLIRVPAGWRVKADWGSTAAVAAGEWYVLQTEYGLGDGTNKVPGVDGSALQTRFGDARIVNGTTRITDKVWPSTSALGGNAHLATSIWGKSAAGAKMVTVTGDSVDNDNSHSPFGSTGIVPDANGNTNTPSVALDAEGYSFNRVPVSGIAVGNPGTYSDAQRRLSMRFSSAVITNMGGNLRNNLWTSGAPSLAMQNHWQRCRTAGLNGNATVCQFNITPLATSTDGAATTANQTSLAGPGTQQYDSFNPYIAAGNFNPATGPDTGWDLNGAIYIVAPTIKATVGGVDYFFTDIDAQKAKWPANGQSTPNALTSDLTHGKGPLYEALAVRVRPLLPTLLRFPA